MRFSDYEQLFSQARMSRYLVAAGGDQVLSKRLYRANLAVSESFLPILSAFEVGLRNRMNHELIRHFGRADWIVRERDGFMRDAALGPDFKMRKDISRAMDKLIREHRTPNGSNVLAEQTLGFWVGMFDAKHYRLLRGVPIHTFPGLPRSYGRLELARDLHIVRMFRNRIYHNEPICFDRGRYSLDEASDVLKKLYHLASWMDPKFVSWLRGVGRTERLITKYECIL